MGSPQEIILMNTKSLPSIEQKFWLHHLYCVGIYIAEEHGVWKCVGMARACNLAYTLHIQVGPLKLPMDAYSKVK